ncbi:hypothetical protein GCM10007190_03450 [Macrococcus hajekii]|nr:hypothetical protein [Macrococcus hajekii]GGA98755.1 hypothetical protein GCM10007190_03450 [Macrococcus hajekii]
MKRTAQQLKSPGIASLNQPSQVNNGRFDFPVKLSLFVMAFFNRF